MKETVVPPAPPPPSIDSLCPGNDSSGEAPMDMDTKEDDIPPAPPAPTISGSGNLTIHISAYLYKILVVQKRIYIYMNIYMYVCMYEKT